MTKDKIASILAVSSFEPIIKGGGVLTVEKNLWSCLANYCSVVGPIKPLLSKKDYAFSAAISYNPNIPVWKARFFENAYMFNRRAKAIDDLVSHLASDYDAIIQYGVMAAPYNAARNKPFAVYIDYTKMLSVKERSSREILSKKQLDVWLNLEKEVYSISNLVFSMSDHTRNSVIEDYGIEPEKVITVGGGMPSVNLSSTKNDYSQKTVIFIGTQFERKGGHALLEAFRIIKDRLPEARLLIVGVDKSSKDSNDGVQFLGRLGQDRIKELFTQSSVFAMPSFVEPYGLAFLEAMAAKLPCVGSDRNAIPEIIEDGVSGYVVPAGDTEKLASKIIKLLENPELSQVMGNAGYEKAKNYTWDKVVGRMYNALSENINKNK